MHECRSLAIAMMLLLSPLAEAASPEQDFDQGPDGQALLRAASLEIPRFSTSLPKIQGVLFGGEAKGPLLGKLPIHNNAAFEQARELLAPIDLLPAEVQEPLKVDWAAILTDREVLLSDAGRIDSTDSSLYTRATALNKEKGELTAEKAKLETAIADFNKECGGQTLPPNHPCWTRQRTLITWSNDFKARAADYGARAQVARDDYEKLKVSGESFRQRVKGWEDAKVLPFVRKAEEELARKEISTFRLQAQTGTLVEDSEVTTRPKPLKLSECLATMERLWARLSTRQRQSRINAREKVLRWMRGAAAGGGQGPMQRQLPFYDREPSKDDDPRFDLQVIRGRACVPDDCCL